MEFYTFIHRSVGSWVVVFYPLHSWKREKLKIEVERWCSPTRRNLLLSCFCCHPMAFGRVGVIVWIEIDTQREAEQRVCQTKTASVFIQLRNLRIFRCALLFDWQRHRKIPSRACGRTSFHWDPAFFPSNFFHTFSEWICLFIYSVRTLRNVLTRPSSPLQPPCLLAKRLAWRKAIDRPKKAETRLLSLMWFYFEREAFFEWMNKTSLFSLRGRLLYCAEEEIARTRRRREANYLSLSPESSWILDGASACVWARGRWILRSP